MDCISVIMSLVSNYCAMFVLINVVVFWKLINWLICENNYIDRYKHCTIIRYQAQNHANTVHFGLRKATKRILDNLNWTATWDDIGHRGTSWDIVGHRWTSWDTVGHRGTPWDTVGHCWTPLDKVGQRWTTLDNVGQRGTTWYNVGQRGTTWDNVGQRGTTWDTGRHRGMRAF